MAKKKARSETTIDKGPVESVEPVEGLIDDKENTQFTDHTELTSKSLPKTSDQYLKNWLSRYEILDNFYQVTLWKYDKPTGEQKSIVDQWQDEILSEHDIGLKYGAGRYLLIINAQDTEGKNRIGSKRIKLHERYNELHRRHLLGADKTPANSVPAITPGFGAMEQLSGTLSLMREMLTMFLPLIVPQGGGENKNMSDMLTNMYKSFNTVMKQNLLDNSQFYNDMQRNIFDMSETVETDGELSGVQGFINGIAPILENVLPLILGGGKPAQSMVKSVKNLPLYGELTKSKAHIKALYGFIEKKHGKKAAGELLKKFNVTAPK